MLKLVCTRLRAEIPEVTITIRVFTLTTQKTLAEEREWLGTRVPGPQQWEWI